MIPIPYGNIIADYFRGNKLGGWHYGGTLPMKQNPKIYECHPNGELAGLARTYIIDSSAFLKYPGVLLHSLPQQMHIELLVIGLRKTQKANKRTNANK